MRWFTRKCNIFSDFIRCRCRLSDDSSHTEQIYGVLYFSANTIYHSQQLHGVFIVRKRRKGGIDDSELSESLLKNGLSLTISDRLTRIIPMQGNPWSILFILHHEVKCYSSLPKLLQGFFLNPFKYALHVNSLNVCDHLLFT